MIAYLLDHFSLAWFNYVNALIDARRIRKGKRIYHGINFTAYALFCALLCWLAEWDAWQIILFGVSAFANRQLSFDIPLNLKRGLKWDYVTPAKPPKAILDRVEIRLFGYNGRAPVVVYVAVFVICFVIKFFV